MQHSVVQALKKQLLEVVLEKDPEASIQLFAMAAMHGDLESLDFIINKLGNSLGNLEEMQLVRDGLADILTQFEKEDARKAMVEQQAAAETQDLLNKFKL